jgi:hypothetical protein
MSKRILFIFLLLFLTGDLLVSAYHYYNLSFDGDLPKIGLPYLYYEKVMTDPFGFDAVFNGEMYSGAGRYMCHWFTVFWCHEIYCVIHSVVKDPVVSIYLSTTAIAMLVHFLFLGLVWLFVRVLVPLTKLQSLMVLSLATIFIQYGEFYHSIGIIDRSPSYIFFYGLQLVLFALWAFPFFNAFHTRHYQLNWVQSIVWVFFSVYLSFSSVLTQPIWFVVCLLMSLGYIFSPKDSEWKRFVRSPHIGLHFSWFLLLCLYAFYVAQFNNEKTNTTTLVQRYGLLLKGIYYWITYDLAIPFMTIWLGVNAYLMHRFSKVGWHRFKQISFWIALFAVCYIGLLPFGGYRAYRPFILRYDTIMPVTFGLVFLLVSSSIFLVKELTNERLKIIYGAGLFLVGFLFSRADRHLELDENEPQHEVLYYLHHNKDTMVAMPVHCNVGTWSTSDYKDPVILQMLTSLYKEWDILQPYQTLYIKQESDSVISKTTTHEK